MFEQVSASSGMLHGMLDKRVNKKSIHYTNVMYDLSQNFVALSLSFTVFHCLSLLVTVLVTKVPDLARATLSLGLFMSQDEAKLQPVKEGHTMHGNIMDT